MKLYYYLKIIQYWLMVYSMFYDKNQLVQRRDNLKWLNDMECRLVLNKTVEILRILLKQVLNLLV